MLSSLAIRQALVPMAAGYLLVMATLGIGLRRTLRPGAGHRRVPRRPAGRPWAALARQVFMTVAGGYLLLGAVVIVYYYGIARVGGNFIESAFTGTAMLIGIAVPLFAAASWLTERCRRRQSSGTAGKDPAPRP